MTRQAGLFEGVGKRVMADVVKQRRESHPKRGGGLDASYRLLELSQRAAREMTGAERVLEAGVGRSGIDQEGVAQLADVAEPLHGRRIHDGQCLGVEADVVPERIADDLDPRACAGAAHASGPASRTAAGTRASNCWKFLRNRSASFLAVAS